MSESKQYKSLFIMCSELRAEVKSLREEMKIIRESKCQHEATASAVQGDEGELCENPNQEIFNQISADVNRLSEDIDKANEYTGSEVARLDIDLDEVKKLEAVKPQVNTLGEHKCPAGHKIGYLNSYKDLHALQIKNIELELDQLSSVRARPQNQSNRY